MGTVFLDFYEPDGTTLIGTLDDEQHLIECEVRPALWELGAGRFVVNRHTAAASTALLQKGNIVKYRVPLIRSTAIWGFVLQDGDFQLVSRKEQGGEHLEYSGPGLIALLSHGRLHAEVYAPGHVFRGTGPAVPNMWRWTDEQWGAILTRAIEEGQEQPDNPLGAISIDFDREEDSDGVPWPFVTGEFQTPIGTDILTLADRLAVAGGLYLIFDAETMTLSAHQSYGSDLTGAFGVGTVRFEKGANLMTELSRKSQTSYISHLITRDKLDIYRLSEAPSWSGGAVYGYLEVGQTDDPALVEDIAQQYMAASLETSEEYELEFTPGQDAAAGEYLPGPGTSATPDNFWLGAMLTVHTGSGEHDLNEADLRLVALRLVLDKATSDASDATKALSLRIVAELSYRKVGPGFGTTHQDPGFCCGPPPPVVTVPPGPETPGATILHIYWNGSSLLDNIASTYDLGDSIASPAGLGGSWLHQHGLSGNRMTPRAPAAAGESIRFQGIFAKQLAMTLGTSYMDILFYTSIGAVTPVATRRVSIPASGSGLGHTATVDTSIVVPATATHFTLLPDNNLYMDEVDLLISAAATPGDPAIPGQGLPQLIGTGPQHAYADHSHVWASITAPTAADDVDAGFPAGTIWVVVDDVDAPSVIYEVWYQLPHDDGSVSWSTRQTQASGVVYDASTTGLVSENVQDAIDEVYALAAASAGTVGNVLTVIPQGMDLSDTGGGVNNTANSAGAIPVSVPGVMLLRELLVRCTVTGTGVFEWGLFDYSTTPAACVKIAGGSGALSSTGWHAVAATSAPVTVAPGNYMLIWKQPAANVPSIRRPTASGAAMPLAKGASGYTWDNTPDITSGGGLWTDSQQAALHLILVGDIISGQQW